MSMYFIGVDIGRSTALSIIETNNALEILSIEVIYYNMNDVMGSDTYKKCILHDLINEVVCDVHPIAFAIEAPFMSRFPKAFGLLSEFMSTIELAVYKANSNVIQYRVSPKEGKMIVNAKSDDKEAMTKALLDIAELSPFVNVGMNEHEIDSIAIGFWVLERYRNEPALYLIDRYK